LPCGAPFDFPFFADSLVISLTSLFLDFALPRSFFLEAVRSHFPRLPAEDGV